MYIPAVENKAVGLRVSVAPLLTRRRRMHREFAWQKLWRAFVFDSAVRRQIVSAHYWLRRYWPAYASSH